MSSFQLVKTMNRAFDNLEGDPESPNWERIEWWISSVPDRYDETIRAIDATNLDQTRIGLCAIKELVLSAFHFMGADADSKMKEHYSTLPWADPATVTAGGDPLDVQWNGLRRMLATVPANHAAAMASSRRREPSNLISALCANLTVVDHAFRFIGIDGEEDMGVVINSVMTCFCTDEAQLEATKAKYNALGVDFNVEGVFPTVSLKSPRDQKDKDDRDLPQGKFLKSVGFQKPVLRQYGPTAAIENVALRQAVVAAPPSIANAVSAVHGSSCAQLDTEHVDALVATASKELSEFRGADLRLHGMLPPYKPQSAGPAGVMEFWVERNGEALAAFYLAFGGPDEQRRLLFDSDFATAARAVAEAGAGVVDPYAADGSVDNFDELWLFACRFAEAMAIARITISFGGFGWRRTESELDTSPPEDLPDTELDEKERLAVAALSEAQVAQIDSVLLADCATSWRKVARIVGTALTKGGEELADVPVGFFAQRVKALVESGKLESQGNLDHMRSSEVRLAD
ncbi:DUF3658 domain-containing protein [Variovorax gossypii]